MDFISSAQRRSTKLQERAERSHGISQKSLLVLPRVCWDGDSAAWVSRTDPLGYFRSVLSLFQRAEPRLARVPGKAQHMQTRASEALLRTCCLHGHRSQNSSVQDASTPQTYRSTECYLSALILSSGDGRAPLWLGLPVLVALRVAPRVASLCFIPPCSCLTNCLAMQQIRIGRQLTLEYGLIY